MRIEGEFMDIIFKPTVNDEGIEIKKKEMIKIWLLLLQFPKLIPPTSYSIPIHLLIIPASSSALFSPLPPQCFGFKVFDGLYFSHFF